MTRNCHHRNGEYGVVKPLKVNANAQQSPASLLAKLENIYQQISSSKDSSFNNRQLCDKLVASAFLQTPIDLAGLENLPASSGHIFILNHHKVNPFYTLENGFQITLDTHFLSAVLAKHYPNITSARVVRSGRHDEHAHQNYFDKFSYIMVNTSESGYQATAETNNHSQFQSFYQNAAAELSRGNNLILCPEGTSYQCEDSPGDFKAGVFKLAALLKPEPLIIPVSIVHFDKIFGEFSPAMTVHQPFKMSERVTDIDRQTLSSFILSFKQEYSDYIAQTRARL
jgi:hypothetical protein